MKFPKPIPVKELATMVGAETKGDENALVLGMNEIHNVERGDLTFVDFERYYKFTLDSAASVILIDQQVAPPEGKTLLITEEPFLAYNKIAKSLRRIVPQHEMVHPTAEIGEGTEINFGATVGAEVKIGKDSYIGSNVVILDRCEIGDGVIINPNTVIGTDAFYYKRWNDQPLQYEKMHSVGRVIIEDNVEIGSGCTIDRGVSGDTIIGAGTKIDNNTHLGHEVKIGKNCLISALVGVAGNVTIGDYVKVWGQVGISKNLKITDHVEILAQSGVVRNIEEPGKYFGSPAGLASQKMRELKVTEQLTLMWKEFLLKFSQ